MGHNVEHNENGGISERLQGTNVCHTGGGERVSGNKTLEQRRHTPSNISLLNND
jgi:hypothetical protein